MTYPILKPLQNDWPRVALRAKTGTAAGRSTKCVIPFVPYNQIMMRRRPARAQRRILYSKRSAWNAFQTSRIPLSSSPSRSSPFTSMPSLRDDGRITPRSIPSCESPAALKLLSPARISLLLDASLSFASYHLMPLTSPRPWEMRHCRLNAFEGLQSGPNDAAHAPYMATVKPWI